MKESVSLIKYDFTNITQKSMVMYAAIYVILILASIILLPELILIGLILFPSSILESILSHGKRYSGRIFGILPIRRSTLVNARYLLSVIITLVTLIFSVLVLIISKEIALYSNITLFKNMEMTIENYTVILIIIAFLMSCIYSGTILFSNIVFSGTKAEISTIIILLISFIISISILLFNHVDRNMIVQMRTDTMVQLTFIVFAIIIGLLFMFVSYLIARRVLANKDLSH